MVINIVTGSHFPQKKLFFDTNHFFNKGKFKKNITSHNMNYVVEIGKQAIKIILSDNYTESDKNKIQTYIKTLFNNQSILITTSNDVPWLKEIETVAIYDLKNG